MLNIRRSLLLLTLFVTITPVRLAAQDRQVSAVLARTGTGDTSSRTTREPHFDGRPLSYWIKAIHDRDEETLSLALDAITLMGPDARAAVPELTRLLSDPFRPVHLGTDSDTTIADKLYDIEVRSAAIDALASIGEAASPATLPVIQWALTVRVIPPRISSREEHERFVALVTLEAEYRIRVIHALGQFGEPGVPALVRLLRSPDPERRKLAAITLGMDVLPIVTQLLMSRNCDDAQLGITILRDMSPAVAPIYLAELQEMLTCDAN
jgi:hypothetical protein